MSQTEEMFLKNFLDALEMANSYKENSTTGINKRFLDSCFMKETLNENGNMEIVPDLDNQKEEIAKTVWFHRGPVAAATKHAEGFHTHLKIISKERKVLGYNLLKLIEKINKRYIKYASGSSADKLCTRVKKELLNMKINLKLKLSKFVNTKQMNTKS